jgi:hypothetical protein
MMVVVATINKMVEVCTHPVSGSVCTIVGLGCLETPPFAVVFRTGISVGVGLSEVLLYARRAEVGEGWVEGTGVGGTSVGTVVGAAVGAMVGAKVGIRVGFACARRAGVALGISEVVSVGTGVGLEPNWLIESVRFPDLILTSW